MRSVILSAVIFMLVACVSPHNDDSLPPPAVEPTKANVERWQADIDRFVAAAKETPIPRGDIMFTGSSSIRLWNLNRDLPNLPAHNHGFGGSQYADVIHFIDPLILDHHPSIIVLYSGDNDIASGKTAEQVRDDTHNLAWQILNALPESRIIIFPPKPSPSRWNLGDEMKKASDMLAALCDQDERMAFIDIWPVMLKKDGNPNEKLFVQDMLHLNEVGYALWSDLLREQLEQLE